MANRTLVALLVGLLAPALWLSAGNAGAVGTIGDGPAPVVDGHLLKYRWVYLPNNFQAQGNVQRMIALLDRAKAAGYNGALLADVKFGRLDDGSLTSAYYDNLQQVLAHARELGLDTIPDTADFGYSESILWHGPDLAEGLPVRAATFRAENGALVAYDRSGVRIVNGDFEQLPASGDQFPGWAFQDQPGVTTFVDRDVRHGGRASLRMTDIGVTNPPYGHGRIHQRIAVEPFHNYHVSVWIKTQDFRGGDVQVLVLGQNPSRTLQYNPVPIQPNQDWWRFDVTFNSLDNSEVLFYFGVWGGGTGTIWWDDGQIEPAGFVNLIRRSGAPVRVTNLDGTRDYVEGRDFEPLVDPKMGRAPWSGSYDLWHEPPVITLPALSAIANGEVVAASYYHMATIYGQQVTASLTEPTVFAICHAQLASLRREFGLAGMFDGWMLGHDEIRVHGWDEAPRAGGGSPGEDLAYNFHTLYDDARELDPGSALFTWSDMFDPYHNAADTDSPYYLVNGNWAGSWEGVPADVIILNWHHHANRRQAAEFFAGRGQRQILAGYYDAPAGEFTDRDWLRDLAGIGGVEGVMYTQWSAGYDQLEAWARYMWGDAPWVTPEPPPNRLYLPWVEDRQSAQAANHVGLHRPGPGPSPAVLTGPGTKP